jgi:hypothetical protein
MICFLGRRSIGRAGHGSLGTSFFEGFGTAEPKSRPSAQP